MVPQTAQELVDAINNGTLPHEATVFEVKKQPPVAAKILDMAVDVAAMSTDGGVIIYGVDEDRATDAFTPTPSHSLASRSESARSSRRTPVSRSSSPSTNCRSTVTRARGSSLSLCPHRCEHHMVESKGQYHYYGRIPGGDRILGQADVALLYERRQRVGAR